MTDTMTTQNTDLSSWDTLYIGLLSVVFMLVCWMRQQIAYSASDFSKVSVQDSKLRSGDQNAGQDDKMTIANDSFRRLFTGLWLRMSGFVTRPAYVGFVVEYFSVTFLLSSIFHIHSSIINDVQS
jgi:hypothetical protein